MYWVIITICCCFACPATRAQQDLKFVLGSENRVVGATAGDGAKIDWRSTDALLSMAVLPEAIASLLLCPPEAEAIFGVPAVMWPQERTFPLHGRAWREALSAKVRRLELLGVGKRVDRRQPSLLGRYSLDAVAAISRDLHERQVLTRLVDDRRSSDVGPADQFSLEDYPNRVDVDWRCPHESAIRLYLRYHERSSAIAFQNSAAGAVSPAQETEGVLLRGLVRTLPFLLSDRFGAYYVEQIHIGWTDEGEWACVILGMFSNQLQVALRAFLTNNCNSCRVTCSERRLSLGSGPIPSLVSVDAESSLFRITLNEETVEVSDSGQFLRVGDGDRDRLRLMTRQIRGGVIGDRYLPDSSRWMLEDVDGWLWGVVQQAIKVNTGR